MAFFDKLKDKAAAAATDAVRQAKDGKWYLWEQYLLTGIRQPEGSDPWA